MNTDTKWFEEVKQSANRKITDRYWQAGSWIGMIAFFSLCVGLVHYVYANWPW